ncbi:Uncharacterised protein [Mycobacteroides abscessus subsp. abscessus]|nr:Uncharacterised protein [Mycobacteroides abscessus subsp. abscessus]
MRTDQTHSAIDFLRPHLCQLEMESLLEVCNVVDAGNPCRISEFGIQRRTQAALVSNRRRPGLGCDGTIGQQLCAVSGQMPVPHLEG